MKVLLTATVQSHICQFHRPLAELLHAHGWEVHAAARDNLAEKNGLKLDFVDRLYDVPFARSPRSLDNLQAYRQLKRILEAGIYDVVHCNTPMGGVVTRLAAGKARRKGTKVYYTAHGFHFYKGAPKRNWLLYYPVERLLSGKTDKLITITQEDQEFAKRKFPCESCRIHGVGVDERRYFPADEKEKRTRRQQMGYEAEQKLLLCVGELLPNKNQVMAVRMMERVVKKYPEAQLLLAGNGPEKENLEREIRRLGLEGTVKMLGYCTNLQEYQQIADLVVACSRREGLPLNVIEAMLSGNPVIATANRGHRELLDGGRNGILVEADDVAAMAAQTERLLGNPAERKELGDRGRRFAARYGAACVQQELREIYEL